MSHPPQVICMPLVGLKLRAHTNSRHKLLIGSLLDGTLLSAGGYYGERTEPILSGHGHYKVVTGRVRDINVKAQQGEGM